MKVIGIETSCDETGIALYDSEKGLLGHSLYSQIPLHAKYGGVVPELASRDHIRKVIPLIEDVLRSTHCGLNEIDGVAYVAGPGLIGALLVGAAVGRSLGYALQVPTIGVHHMEAHLLAPLLEENKPSFPFVALLVSGGHTLLVEVTQMGGYHILGESVDDAAGEAFDKTAKLLGLPYPGGPALAKLAQQGCPKRFHFPRPMVDRPGLDFSFSGLKTFAVNTFYSVEGTEQDKADIGYAFQEAVVDTLMIKCRRALSETGLSKLVIAGGVSANQALRSRLQTMIEKVGGQLFYPRLEFCTDNGAMVAYTGCKRLCAGEHDTLPIAAKARWPLSDLNPIPS